MTVAEADQVQDAGDRGSHCHGLGAVPCVPDGSPLTSFTAEMIVRNGCHTTISGM